MEPDPPGFINPSRTGGPLKTIKRRKTYFPCISEEFLWKSLQLTGLIFRWSNLKALLMPCNIEPDFLGAKVLYEHILAYMDHMQKKTATSHGQDEIKIEQS